MLNLGPNFQPRAFCKFCEVCTYTQPSGLAFARYWLLTNLNGFLRLSCIITWLNSSVQHHMLKGLLLFDIKTVSFLAFKMVDRNLFFPASLRGLLCRNSCWSPFGCSDFVLFVSRILWSHCCRKHINNMEQTSVWPKMVSNCWDV